MLAKIDVSIQSYKKPESLIYSLLSLHKHCKSEVDTVWINDDQSSEDVIRIYESSELKEALYPWKIKVRRNLNRMGWWVSFVRGYKPKYLSHWYMFIRMAWNFYKNKTIYVAKDDVRYQWAIDHTDKEYLFIMHDDVTFKDNVIKRYMEAVAKMTRPAIVGDLGQCWRCAYEKLGCNPYKILSGYRPSVSWPYTKVSKGDHHWACRINEWSALISVNCAKFIEDKYRIFYGNYDNKGDVSAYWFSRIVNEGFSFDDPISSSARDQYYLHWENGATGHSVWVNQGFGKSSYNANFIKNKLQEDFDFTWLWG